ncbi:hypothetical protein I7I50_02919 [Histoplasma capsulatum G186AR]|uniref:Acylphosphatase-like domain-containing protein n=1 Tax=Ajellomyces capsulatus TaxID=5037 RepID=A0A8H7Z4X4_AJECA|nr:hypothetical protein I7I52_00415 [Histoplasma capsulatum]QSS71903.1 hypothetical protein I7I50_02919 [Histoplasma capsulatum G186AR]
MSKRISFRVHGKVQGVFFRDFTRRNANNYNLTGWVRNTPDGKVEGEAQGDEAALSKLLEDLSQGPELARVVKLEKSEIDLKDGEESFVVTRG